jgi:peptidyl-prolyl cis-trans isomerase A (cyclophilin A)
MTNQVLTRCCVALIGICLATHALAQPTRVRVQTTVGDIVLVLDDERAPVSVQNFLSYVDDGSYANTIFHRVMAGFMVQGGGLYVDLSEAPEGETIHNEADNGLHNVRGSIAMARMQGIDTASRQFFINVVDNLRLDHNPASCTREDEAAEAEARAKGLYKPQTCKPFGYAVFGHVESGMEFIDLIELSDTHFVAPYDDVPVNPVIILSIERLPETSGSED